MVTVAIGIGLSALLAGCGSQGEVANEDDAATSSTAGPTSSIDASSTSPPTTTRPAASPTSSTTASHISNGAMPADAVPLPQGVELTLTVDPTRVQSGDEVSATMTLTNSSSDSVPIRCPDGTGLFFDGEPVEGGFGCAAVEDRREVKPGESFTWNTNVRTAVARYDPQTNSAVSGPVAPGKYYIFGFVRNDSGYWYSNPIAIDIS